MRVYIKGMEMYERCNDQDGHWSCPLFGSVYPYGFFCKVTTKEIDNPFSKQPDCPLIPIQTHGRLGDLEELYAHLNEWYLTNNPVFTKEEALYIRTMLLGIVEAPTIIPAEEGE